MSNYNIADHASEKAHSFPGFALSHRNGVLSGLFQNIASIVNSLILVRLVLTHFSAADAGTWLLFLSVGAYVSFLDFGITQNLTREVAFIMGSSDDRATRLRSLTGAAIKLLIPIVCGSFILLILFGYFYFSSTDVSDFGMVMQAWFLFCAGAVSSIISSTLLAAVFGAGNLVSDKLGRAFSQMVSLILMAVAVLLAPDLRVLSLIWFIQNVILISYAYFEFRKINLASVGNAELRQEYTRKFTGTIAYWTAVGLGNVFFFNFGGALVGANVSIAAVPQFDIPWRIAGIALAALSVYVTTGAPRISALYAAGDKAEIKDNLLRLVRVTLLIAGFMASGAVWLGVPIIDLWTGGKVIPSLAVLVLVGFFIIIEAHTRLHMAFINATGQFVVGWSTLLMGVIALGSGWFLSSSLGVVGVFAAQILALTLTNAWLAPGKNLAKFGIRLSEYFSCLVLPFVLCGLVAAAIYMERRSMNYDLYGYEAMLIHGLLLALIYGLAIRLSFRRG